MQSILKIFWWLLVAFAVFIAIDLIGVFGLNNWLRTLSLLVSIGLMLTIVAVSTNRFVRKPWLNYTLKILLTLVVMVFLPILSGLFYSRFDKDTKAFLYSDLATGQVDWSKRRIYEQFHQRSGSFYDPISLDRIEADGAVDNEKLTFRHVYYLKTRLFKRVKHDMILETDSMGYITNILEDRRVDSSLVY